MCVVYQSFTFFNSASSPGASVMLAVTITNSSITAYMSRVDVELAHDGQAEQQSEHAALPQQHANCQIFIVIVIN